MSDLFRRWGWDVHFAFAPMESADQAAHAARFGKDRFHLLRYEQPMPSWPVRALRKAARLMKHDAGYLWDLDAWYDVGLTQQLKTLHTQHQFDLVCVEYVFMSKALEAFGDEVIKVLDTHDCFAERHRRYLRQGQEPQWFSCTEQDETRGFLRANAVLAIQSQEAKRFAERVENCRPPSCTVLEFGHILPDVAAVQPSSEPVGIFLGSDNPINVNALRWFIEDVMPLVQAKEPRFQLKVAGSVCKAIVSTDTVHCMGFVDDLASAFSQACVNVNPIRMGTGVNIKLLDAMMYGMPCVSTRTGARGLEQYAGLGVSVVDDTDAQGFADLTLSCIHDPLFKLAQAGSARQAAMDWNKRQQSQLRAWVSAQSDFG